MTVTKTQITIINTTDKEVLLRGRNVVLALPAAKKPVYLAAWHNNAEQAVKGMVSGISVVQPREVFNMPEKKNNVRYFVSSEVFQELSSSRSDLVMAETLVTLPDYAAPGVPRVGVSSLRSSRGRG